MTANPRAGRAKLCGLLGLLMVAFVLAGCREPLATLSLADVLAGLTEIRLDFFDSAGDYHRMATVCDEGILSTLKKELAQAQPTPPPERWPWDSFALSFKVMQGQKTIETQRYAYWFKHFSANEDGYIHFPDGWYKVSGQFNSLLNKLTEYRQASSKIDPADADFLKEYGWTALFHINTLSLELPAVFRHLPGEYPAVLYWAYNNELNKDIGLDLTPYLGQTVEARLYKIGEPLPEFMHPRRDAGRAVVVHQGEKIIGAWLDAGRHYGFACSLRGRRLEEITGKSWDEWVAGVVDTRNDKEKELAQLSPEEIILTYFGALDRGDYVTAHACETRKNLVRHLFTNMDNNLLYNPGFGNEEGKGLGNIRAARVLGIRRAEALERDRPHGTRLYEVRVDLKVKETVTHGSGQMIYFVSLRQEIPAAGWRIDGIGTGP